MLLSLIDLHIKAVMDSAVDFTQIISINTRFGCFPVLPAGLVLLRKDSLIETLIQYSPLMRVTETGELTDTSYCVDAAALEA